MSGKPVIILPITQMSASIASIGNFSSRRLLPVIAKLTEEAKLLITENWINIDACLCMHLYGIHTSFSSSNGNTIDKSDNRCEDASTCSEEACS